MSIRDVLQVLRRQWVAVCSVFAAVVAIVAYVTFTAVPIYTASSTVFATLSIGSNPGELYQGSNYVQGQMASYAELLRTTEVLTPAAEELGLAPSAPEFAAVSASVVRDSSLLKVSASSKTPDTAAAVANSAAASLSRTVEALSPTKANGEPTVRMTTVREASTPTKASSPNVRRNLVAGVFAGLLLGIAAAFLRYHLDTRLRTSRDVTESTQLPLLSELLLERDKSSENLVTIQHPQSRGAEAYRRLRASIQFLEVQDRPLALVLTSAGPAEGKSTVAINLAIACAQAGDRVLLVDADLRKPTIAQRLGLVGSAGLTTVLVGQASLGDVVQCYGTRGGQIDVLASGLLPPNSAGLLGSKAMDDLLAKARANYDIVILDTPPVLPVVDAAVVASRASGAILVARLNKVHRDHLRHAEEQLNQMGAKCLGLVINGVVQRREAPYSDYSAAQRKSASRG